MKLLRAHPSNPAGSILMMALVVTGVLGFTLFAYLRLLQSHHQLTVRSQAWHNCLPIVEAGIEEALVQLNSHGNNRLAPNGWTATALGFTKTRTLGRGYFEVEVNCTNIHLVTITSKGHLPAPVTVASAATPRILAAAVPDPHQTYLSRTVRVVARKEPAWLKGMIARESISFGGNKCSFDSYDSSLGAYDAATARDNGDVMVNEDLLGSASLGNADIKGHLTVGPRAKLTMGPNSVVGSLAWHAAGNKGIEPAWLRRDANLSIPDVTPPWTSGVFPPTGDATNNYVMNSGNYELGSLTLSSKERIHVKGNVVLYVKSNVNISGQIKFNPGASLKLYVAGPQAIFSGTYDKSDIASDFVLFGLPSLKQISVEGIAAVIYAPDAALNINGGGNFYGASVSKSASINGNTAFHYDEALAHAPQYRQYVILSWNEI